MEARAAALKDLEEQGVLEEQLTDRDDIEQELEDVEADAEIDAELEAIKAEVSAETEEA